MKRKIKFKVKRMDTGEVLVNTQFECIGDNVRAVARQILNDVASSSVIPKNDLFVEIIDGSGNLEIM